MAAQRPRPFQLERFFAKHEFAITHNACASDCEPLLLSELLVLADREVQQMWQGLRLAYTESQGLPQLRQAISQHVYGGALEPDQLLICVPEEGIHLVMQALLQPGDAVVSMAPAYQSLTELAEAAGARVSCWEPLPSGAAGGLRFDVADAARLIQATQPKLVVANFPHNPTGAMLSREDGRAFLDAVRAAGAYLLSDAMYRHLEWTDEGPLPPAAASYERAITLCGLSKSWGVPGLRLGWLATQDADLLQRLLALKDYTTICSPAPSEVLALAAVRATPQLTQRSRDIVRANLAVAEGFFARWRDTFDWEPPQGGPIAFPRLKTGEPIEAFCERLVAEAGVLLLPATIYDHAPSIEAGRFRIGLGRRDLPACLAAFDDWLVHSLGRDGDS